MIMSDSDSRPIAIDYSSYREAIEGRIGRGAPPPEFPVIAAGFGSAAPPPTFVFVLLTK